MKKLLLISLLSLGLAACGNVTTNVSNANDVLISIGNEDIKVGQVYSALIAQDSSTIIKEMAQQIILNKEIEITEEMKAEAQIQLDEFTTNMGENAELYLQYYGYKDMDDYYTNGILPTLQQDVLVDTYLNNNYATLAVSYQPKKVRIIEVSDAALADAALAEIQGGADFSTVATKYTTAAYPGYEELVYNQSELPEVVLVWMNLQTKPTLSPVLPDTTNATNYIVQVTEADVNKLQSEVIANFKLDTTFVDKTIAEAFIRNEFKLYDKSVYDKFIATYPSYITK